MEKSSKEEESSDEDGGNLEDGEVELTSGYRGRTTHTSGEHLGQRSGPEPTGGDSCEGHTEKDSSCDPSILQSPCSSPHSSSILPPSSSSSSSSALCLTPPLPPEVELSAILTDTSLTLDVYLGGAAVVPLLWDSNPERLKKLQYLRLGSEDQTGLDSSLDVLQHLTALRSLAIRGHCFHDSRGDPLPGLVTNLPASFSSLSNLVHLDLSFNQLSFLPPSLLQLRSLSSLLLCHNHLSHLPPDVGRLSSLRFLSLLGNKLVSLPSSMGQIQALESLDVSYNNLQELPDEIGSLEQLVKLELSHNKLTQLPESMGFLRSLRELIIYSNDLRLIPPCVNNLPHLKIDARDNPLGKPPTPPPLPVAPDQTKKRIPELHLRFNQHSFCVSLAGCHVFIPGGAELVFPPGCLMKNTRLKWAWRKPERKWVCLEEHDVLLSRPLELCPHGVTFIKPVEVCVPYHRARKGSEVVVRTFDRQSWSTLCTERRKGSDSHSRRRTARLACCSVSHFSWFIVVSRPARDSCSVTAAGALLVSSCDPGIKLTFPPDSTVQTRSITLQVLQVSVQDVRDLCGDPEARVSPLLCLTQNPSLHFLEQVKVQIPLPSGVTGHTVDLSCLHLFHGDPAAQTWADVTSQVSLCVTHLYAVFYVTHFSWYWLWYTTQRCVSGVVRKVYQKLKQFRVRFLVLQRKTDPSQVLLQCLPDTLKYDGPQPSDLCDLLEGEQFFAGFERGLDVTTDRPDCIEGRLCFVFYSAMNNLKEVYICAAQGHKGSVRGQVSFYRGDVPAEFPEEVSRRRKGPDKQWLTTLPLRLPARNSENTFIIEENQYPPLNLGDPETGYLTEANLLSISLQIGHDWRVIGIHLGLSYAELDRIQYKNRDNLEALVLDMLFLWAQRRGGPGGVARLVAAMIESGRTDVAEEIQDIVDIGKRKYCESLRKVGLEAESSAHRETQQEATPTLSTDS
ncbi:p53-induced death domain-containing protein 1 isoform X2 [Gouania willdenowi]|uniref:p53-induced death domain-containing protein 1 isoform X2 n=1 Tax=Gouania willdenowi TaxID=441366 RepID=UPI001055F763|nr:p53-induced death domain-containing protein 1 isoform X2 [Gouania willdenowi]